jgi:hypothetical protein
LDLRESFFYLNARREGKIPYPGDQGTPGIVPRAPVVEGRFAQLRHFLYRLCTGVAQLDGILLEFFIIFSTNDEPFQGLPSWLEQDFLGSLSDILTYPGGRRRKRKDDGHFPSFPFPPCPEGGYNEAERPVRPEFL